MSERFWVRLCKENLIFSASHFITFAGNVCEALHGHNYGVAAYVYGPLDENHYVVDFIALHDSLKDILKELDHHTLLPTQHRAIRVQEEGDEVEVRFETRRWVFPRQDCTLLPVANTTAELLAKYIATKLRARLKELTDNRIERVRVEVDENAGQWAACELTDD